MRWLPLLAMGCLPFSTVGCLNRQKAEAATAPVPTSAPVTVSIRSTRHPQLMTPEQFARQVKTQFGITMPANYNLPLGGIDHDTVYERDRQLHVQTLLAVQALAWDAAVRIMNQELKPKLARIFIQDNPKTLSPTSNADAWKSRVQDLYIHILNRSPSAAEQTFWTDRTGQLINSGGTPLQSWTAITYTLLASGEFWNL